MGIHKRYGIRGLRLASNPFLVQILGSISIVALIFCLFAYYKPEEKGGTQAQFKCCVDNRAVLFFSLPGTGSLSSLLLPLIQFTSVNDAPFMEIMAEDGQTWKAAALKTDSVGMLLAEFSKELKENLSPLISIILDNSGAEYLLLIGTEGQLSLSSMKFLIDHFFVEMKGTPSIQINIPNDWNHNERIPFYLRVY